MHSGISFSGCWRGPKLFEARTISAVGVVGVLEGADDEVAAGLRGRVGRGGIERRALGERALLDRAVDLVGGDLQVADAGVAGGLEQDEGAEDVGLDELAGGLDRAVDVRLGGEVDERVAALDRRGRPPRGRRCRLRPARSPRALEVLGPAGVGELVEHADLVAGVLLEPVADVGGADEAGAARDEELHASSLSRSAR